MNYYKTSLNFSVDTRPKIRKLQTILEDREKKTVTKGEALERAIDLYIKVLEDEK